MESSVENHCPKAGLLELKVHMTLRGEAIKMQVLTQWMMLKLGL